MKLSLFLISGLLFAPFTSGLSRSVFVGKSNKTDKRIKTQTINTLPGAIPPTGFFDPLNITKSLDDSMVLYLREAEQQHGRVAMLSMVVMPTIDILDKTELAINVYQKHQEVFLSKEYFVGVLLTECTRLFVQYENPMNKTFRLKEGAYPGNLFQLDMLKVNDTLINKELSNGRLAMVSALCYILQELVTHTKVISL